jgi:hypothetical protein
VSAFFRALSVFRDVRAVAHGVRAPRSRGLPASTYTALLVAGPLVCANGAVDPCAGPTCNTDADCSSGELCFQTIFCDVEGNRCVPVC